MESWMWISLIHVATLLAVISQIRLLGKRIGEIEVVVLPYGILFFAGLILVLSDQIGSIGAYVANYILLMLWGSLALSKYLSVREKSRITLGQLIFSVFGSIVLGWALCILGGLEAGVYFLDWVFHLAKASSPKSTTGTEEEEG